ncbi:hypothetical protein BSKO_04630 [Bryopsis sp. KO-2023]|nr:hypothetical protein BSKO_04630 [Bryopsis sp. KO-2023]
MPKLSDYHSRTAPTVQQTPPPSTGEAATTGRRSDAFNKAVSKLDKDYKRRCQELGPRLFRQADGSLQPKKPPPNPYAVGNRRSWDALVKFCRETGGLAEFEKTGKSYRHGNNTSFDEHQEFLSAIGLEPEVDSDGSWMDFDPEMVDPMTDPQHPFNSFFKTEAQLILAQAPSRVGIQPTSNN